MSGSNKEGEGQMSLEQEIVKKEAEIKEATGDLAVIKKAYGVTSVEYHGQLVYLNTLKDERKELIIERDGPQQPLQQQQPQPESVSELVQILKALDAKVANVDINTTLTQQEVKRATTEDCLTPSNAMSDAGGKAKFDTLFGDLRINPAPTKRDATTPALREGKTMSFQWTGTDGQEKREGEAYAPTVEFLSGITNGLPVVNCSEGKNVALNGNLFDRQLFSLRKAPLFDERGRATHGEIVKVVQRVRGRTDLAVLRRAYDGQLVQFHVRVGIEIKPPSIWKSNSKGCEREAMTQLIGLSARHSVGAVPVILTNLVKVHRVYYLELVSDCPLEFRVVLSTFANLANAVHFALDLPEVKHIDNLGRPTTPFASSDEDSTD